MNLVEAVAREFDDIPREAVVKEDCLRRGLWFTEEALRSGHEYARKSYFIFSFDHRPLEDMADAPHRDDAPEEIALEGGPWGFQRVIVSVRLNPDSPWLIELGDDDQPVLRCGDTTVCQVAFSPRPPYYGQELDDGTPITEVAPSIEWGYLLYLTVFRMCQYFGKEEECQFCDINRNFKQQRALGRPYFAVKPVDRLLEALDRVVASGSRAKAYTLTGGSVTSQLEGLTEAEFYVRYAEAIESRFPGRWTAKMVVQALPKEDVQRIHDAGIVIYHPNYEIWDRELFERICPGKARYVGRDTWISRILDAAEVFGPERVIPNFVGGIETARPFGFRTEEEAWASTGEGLEFFMSRGIAPRFTTWCPEPLSVLGKETGPATLRYHVGLLRTWRDTHARHDLPAPPGYGEPGLGNAVFSVSSFMDVIAPGTRTLPARP
ncbi:MAG: radical SAM protein [Planctomycetes bacterium]|nr:radical SAM protein [Planctomycetota bacterium]